MQKNINFASIILNLDGRVELPEKLREFLELDDQGMDGLEFMLQDSKLFRKIPQDVRLSYETLYASLSSDLDSNLKQLEESIKTFRNNPKKIIHTIIQQNYE